MKMDANKTFRKSVNELSEYAYGYNNETERRCSKCANQQKINIIIFCILFVVISVNAVLAVNQITDAHRLQTLQNTIDILKSQVKEIRLRQDEVDVEDGDNQDLDGATRKVEKKLAFYLVSRYCKDNDSSKVDILDTFPFQINPFAGDQSREKRNTNSKPCNDDPNCKKRTRRQQGRRKKKKKERYIHIEGTGGEAYPKDNFAGVFHKWQLANWIKWERKGGKKSLFTKRGGFVLNLQTGELTIENKGLYFLYSQITLMGHGNQSYSIEKNKKEKIASCYFFRDTSNTDDHNYLKRYTSCSTMGLFQFDKRDTIRLRHDQREGVMAYFEPNASFFGLIKLK
ncbi:uncharacterized protein LOC143066917 isoform X4 [Mytilus galloprovincialis]|uniref:uncharacterized protein LOC143066917 isoform X4 n=1 Tax=Mytilus galloprovincialis TaxID=29158 RepID=UPI003F7CA577